LLQDSRLLATDCELVAVSRRTGEYPRYFNEERFKMRYLLFGLIATAGLIDAAAVKASTWTIAPPRSERSKEIKAMDIMERPNRPLHVYGDFVRMGSRRR
jgi:hypothetical protein